MEIQCAYSKLVGWFFEICVKLVKRCLKKVLGNAKLGYEELESVLVETEGVLNSSACSTSGCSRQLNYLRQVRLKRPIQMLYPLDGNARDEDPVTVVGASVHPGSRNIRVVKNEDIPAVTIAT